ncbi:putative disease resistance protein RGA4 [Miscanthus floridulus]|uniref:putative disease resistance protein RGA4 n=1 Tax=Miscanthus floridulus TaxID=154761 RepID=UPI00345850CF
MVDVAGLLASAIVTQVGAKLGSVIGDQVSMLCCFEDDMEDMKATLESMEATLEDAEKRSIKEEVWLWLKRLKNAALDISDMIDECHTDSEQTDGKMTGIFSCLDIASKISMANKMKKIRDQLRKIKEDHQNFRFEPYQRMDNDHLFITDRETTSMINKADIVGRDKERKRVIALLSASNIKEGAAILPIFGLGGIGKTTLAQLVFSDIHFKEYDHRVWVYVSQVLDMKWVGNTIISQVLKKGRHDGDNMEFIN